jgi:leucyl aminopeptidase
MPANADSPAPREPAPAIAGAAGAPLSALLLDASAAGLPVHLVAKSRWPALKAGLKPVAATFADAQGYEPSPGKALLLPGVFGDLDAVILGREEADARRVDPFGPGRLSATLPAGDYRLTGDVPDPALAALGWLLSAYRFDRYRKPAPVGARLVAPEGVDAEEIRQVADAVALGRDLINTPASDMGPEEIEAAIRALAARHGAQVTSIVGEALLPANFPMVHAVGRASARAPRLIDLTWGEAAHPKVTLVGKGVVFDTGGLDLKPSAAMLLMKKDMGGAASAIAAAAMVMAAKLPVRLRLIVPAVENSVSANAFRPSDVLASRKGITVEIGNTDAEGRLILADALALADEEAPELLIDFATLTGAARTALGPDLPPLFTHDESLAADMQRLGREVNDPVWRLPLWPPYDRMLESKVADMNNTGASPFAGAITAALFLARFVEKAQAYAHLDIYGWTPATKPGRPEGGEPQGARLAHALVKARYPR